jgi:hypothetical protein
MSGFFRRFFRSDFGPPPPPDVMQLPSFSGQHIVETIYSEPKRERVFITLDESGDYRVISSRGTRAIGRPATERVGVAHTAAAVTPTVWSALGRLQTTH